MYLQKQNSTDNTILGSSEGEEQHNVTYILPHKETNCKIKMQVFLKMLTLTFQRL